MDWEMTCALCQISGKSRTTGPLLTRDNLTVHENCMLYSSGLFCPNSPVNGNLIGGFLVVDVIKEITRGSKLMCHLCKQKGATVGCEVKRCKKSYHYPCALNAKAEKVKNRAKGLYTVYCEKHCDEKDGVKARKPSDRKAERPSSLNGDSHIPMRKEAITMDNGDANIFNLCYGKLNGMDYSDAVAGPSYHASDSDTSKHSKHTSAKKPLSPYIEQEVTPPSPETASSPNRKRRRVLDSSSNSDEEGSMDMEFAPLEYDLDDNGHSEHRVDEPQHQPSPSKDAENQIASTSGHQSPPQNEDDDETEETLIDSYMEESQSLLLPVTIIPMTDSTVDTSCELSPAAVSPPPDLDPVLPDIPEPVDDPCDQPQPPDRDAVTDSVTDSADFWRNCNLAGCTEAIFDSFITDMRDLSKRIWADQASQEDYDVSLAVLKASGKLSKLVAHEGKEREKKLKEAKESLDAMNKAWSILRK